MSRDITGRMNEFREAARHLWNVHFRSRAECDLDWDLRDAYSDVYLALFNALVRYDLPDEAPPLAPLWDSDGAVLPAYRVVGGSDPLPVMINRDRPASGYWDYPVEYLPAATSDLRLIALFDWNELGWRDFRYYRVRILAAEAPDCVGRDALVNVDHCRVEYAAE